MNKWIGMGRATRDPDIKYSQGENSMAIARFTLAVQRKLDKEKTDFLDCVAFGKLAEIISTYVKKGNRIIVCGSIQTNIVEDAKEKTKTKYTSIIVDDFYFTEAKAMKEEPEELPFA